MCTLKLKFLSSAEPERYTHTRAMPVTGPELDRIKGKIKKKNRKKMRKDEK